MWCVYFDVDECSSSTYIHTYNTRISEDDGGGHSGYINGAGTAAQSQHTPNSAR
jgi:hypothetical protein